ncbi:MAG: DNA (cytosine-5-)-methyltransferase [Clostridia bacterium]
MPVQVIDLFCGVGGLTRGLLDANLNVIAGIDNDPTCEYAYNANNQIPFHCRNIRDITGDEINAVYGDDNIKVLVGCAPCQPFSTMRFKLREANQADENYDLLLEFGRIIQETTPDIISMENVPQIMKTNVYTQFINILEELNYSYSAQIVYCPDYGISQSRRRFVLLASRYGDIELVPSTHNRNEVFVSDFIANIPPIAAGEVHPNDPMHRTARLSDKNMQRIQASVPGGTWRDWPEELLCDCHKKESGQTFSSVYGRMRWNQIGPTITTQFYCYGTGRYGHPEQDRALTLREGALLQTFPENYNFINPDRQFSLKDIARHIGNAVPVRLGEVIGISINNHLNSHGLR